LEGNKFLLLLYYVRVRIPWWRPQPISTCAPAVQQTNNTNPGDRALRDLRLLAFRVRCPLPLFSEKFDLHWKGSFLQLTRLLVILTYAGSFLMHEDKAFFLGGIFC
jgi:hypothetical protein